MHTKFTSKWETLVRDFFFSPAAHPDHLPDWGLRLGFLGTQVSHNFSCEPPASSHVNRVNRRIRVRLGFLGLRTHGTFRTNLEALGYGTYKLNEILQYV